ncbi:MAG: outer membrane beta-barrel protein [Flavobacteriales bacterium]|nr:outer membrane beta-barrel protein [Flavobacteriales bacterium]
MKKILLIAIMFVSYNVANAQIAYGIKAGLNYNMADVSTKIEDYSPENKAGFNVGAFLRVKIPIIGLYAQVEPTYTKLNTGLKSGSESTTLSTNRFDLPVLAGIKMLGLVRLYAGPVFSWNLGSDIDLEDYKVVIDDKSSVGGQVGVGVELWKILLDVRYEFGVGHDMSIKGLAEDFTNQGSQVILGVAYKF